MKTRIKFLSVTLARLLLCVGVAFSALLMSAGQAPGEEPTGLTASRAEPDDWYERSWIHSHVSLGLPPSELDFISRQIKSAGLDAVQFHTGNLDLWDAARKARLDNKLNVKMVAIINAAGSWYTQYDKDPAYVKRIHPDGSFAGRWNREHLCFNAPIVRERVIPEKYQKLPARLKPDQIWIDECIITVNLCWCEHCERLYRKRYKTDPPTKLTADNHKEWTQWTTFHRESFERWMADVQKAVDSSVPGTLVTFNHAWFVEQPETPPAYIKNLSADIHNDNLELGLYARYGGSGSIPFDLMPGLGSDIWAGVRPKKLGTILNEVALITAHGGRWNIGEYPTDSTSLRKEPKYRGNGSRPADKYVDLARKGAAFARERQHFCQHTKPVPYVALLHSASTHYDHVIQNFNDPAAKDGYGKTSDGTFRRNQPGLINSRVYWPGNHPIDESVVGAYQALLENHIHFNFTIEDRLAEELKNAAMIVLPEQHRLSPASVEAIKQYVRNGGRLLATGSTRHAGLDDVLDFESEKPKRVGNGQSLYLRENLFQRYSERSGYSHQPKGDAAALRKETARIFKMLLPENPYTFDAPPWFEWTLRRNAKETELLVHLINRKINWSLPSDLSAAPLRCSLLLDSAPEAVSLEPGGENLKWSFDGSRLVITLDPNSVRNHRIIRINTAPSHPTTKLSPVSLDTIALERKSIDYRDMETGSIIPDED